MTEEEQGVTEEQLVAEAEPIQEDPQEKNWREVNRILKEQKQAIDRLAMEKQELAGMLTNFMQPKQADEEDDLDVYSPDFGKKLEKKLEKAVYKTYEQIEQKRKSDPAYIEEQARKKYSDFDSVVTSDNIDTIIKSNPLVHEAIMSSKRPLEAAYEFIKNSAAYVQKSSASSTMQRLAQDDRKKLAEKQSAPKSPLSVPRSTAMSGISGFGKMTKEQMEEINRDTNRILKGR